MDHILEIYILSFIVFENRFFIRNSTFIPLNFFRTISNDYVYSVECLNKTQKDAYPNGYYNVSNSSSPIHQERAGKIDFAKCWKPNYTFYWLKSFSSAHFTHNLCIFYALLGWLRFNIKVAFFFSVQRLLIYSHTMLVHLRCSWNKSCQLHRLSSNGIFFVFIFSWSVSMYDVSKAFNIETHRFAWFMSSISAKISRTWPNSLNAHKIDDIYANQKCICWKSLHLVW